MKCDRQVPCSHCVRRHRVSECMASSAANQAITPHKRSMDHPHKSTKTKIARRQDGPPAPRDHVELTAAAPGPSTNPSSQPSVQEPSTLPRELQSQQQQHEAMFHLSNSPFSTNSGGAQLHMALMGNAGGENNSAQLDHLAFLASSMEHSQSAGSPFVVASAMGNPAGMTLQGTFPPSNSYTQFGETEDSMRGSYGTLLLGKGGRSKYLGPTAGSEWLKDSETQIVSDTPSVSRAPSPKGVRSSSLLQSINRSEFLTSSPSFPFNQSPSHVSTRELVAHLPPQDEALNLVESYYRYCAWHHDVVPRSSFDRTFERVYSLVDGLVAVTPTVNPQEIALVFSVVALGTMYNIELPYRDPSIEEWLHLSERALVKGEFLSNNMLAGLQTLHLMAHIHLQLDKGQRGDNAWPLWGLVMRLAQAMGMHRDGARWNLPLDVVEERRKVWWECNTADTFQAHCFSRPCAMNPEHCDTAFPFIPLGPMGEKSYTILRFELSQISSEILNITMKVRKPPYSDVTDLDMRLVEFERNVPRSLRSRAALLAMPSRYPLFETAIQESPEPSKRSITLSFQQMNLALNISETIINLHRPYFAKALYENIEDRLKSVYAPSYLTVIERCAIIIGIVGDIYARFPAVSTRQWNFWFHVFGSALCLGTLVLRDPGNALARFILAQIDAAVELFNALIQSGANNPRYARNLQWLIKLRTRASAKVSAAASPGGEAALTNQSQDLERNGEGGMARGDREDSEDVELVGWRTRLIERAGQGTQVIKTVTPMATPSDSHFTAVSNTTISEHNILGGHKGQLRFADLTAPGSEVPAPNGGSDNLLQEFWDPMLIQELFAGTNTQDGQNVAPMWWEDNAPVPNTA